MEVELGDWIFLGVTCLLTILNWVALVLNGKLIDTIIQHCNEFKETYQDWKYGTKENAND